MSFFQPSHQYTVARGYILEVYGDIPHWEDIRRYTEYIVWALAPGEQRIVPSTGEPINVYLDRIHNLFLDEFESVEEEDV